jgi:hypothetical protein
LEQIIFFIAIAVIGRIISAILEKSRPGVPNPPAQAGPAVPGAQRPKQAARSHQPSQQTRQTARPNRPSSPEQKTRKTPAANRPEATQGPSGAGVRQHVESYITDHVRTHLDSTVDDSVKKHINQHVQAHIGSEISADATGADGPDAQTTAGIRKLLRDPGGIRNAMLVNEILSRPRTLRR